MNERTQSLITLMIIGLAFAAQSASAQQTRSYLLTCKAGENAIEIDNRLEQSKLSSPVTSAHIRYTFKRSRGAASAGLAPGQCAWADRAVRDNEPALLRFRFHDARLVPWIFQVSEEYRVTFQVRGSGQTPSPGQRQLSEFIRAYQRGTEFQVHVYSDGEGALIVTRYGP